jgi:predicted MFS family arabinose efflux permease
MSSKSAVKLLVKDDSGEESQSTLFKWVALLTGSKNALKGMGFFLGGVLLSTLGFQTALWVMAGALAIVLFFSVLSLKQDMGKSKEKVKFRQLFSKSREINLLSVARFFLFGSRDVWFVVGLPIFLKDALGWSFSGVGGFLAAWVIGYGFVQAAAPKLLRRGASGAHAAQFWGFALAFVSAAIALSLQFSSHPTVSVLAGLAVFGVVFAINSSVHSYLILAYTDSDKVALNVGFYYMANACGRLTGTLLSGGMYLIGGLTACLWVSTALVLAAASLTVPLRAAEAQRQADLSVGAISPKSLAGERSV